AGWPGASIAPTTRSVGSSRAREINRRPMRPAAPHTARLTGSERVILAQDPLELLAIGPAHARDLQAELLRAESHEGDRGLHRDGVHLELHGERSHEGQQVVHPAAG